LEWPKTSGLLERIAQSFEETGGLYKPADYVPGRRYPLVIQTHGFTDKFFIPSGTMSTAFAARAFAATGIIVLQVKGCPVHVSMTAEEAPCNVRGYEAAVKQLNAEGVIDPEKIGIIGFSRTCYYIMEALTTSSLRFKAASITDGLNYGYLQYLLGVDLRQDALAHEYEAVYKANPFGDGLQQWIEHSPEFKMQRVKAPLMVVGEGPASVLEMWEPYAALRYQNKPTDLILLNTKEHIPTNPAVRMASQGGSVDWFRFWLQSCEDAATKAEQYQRWEKLCDIQRAENPTEAVFCIGTKR
jgi:dipeptidyl aminopeptidase/acylaminoacyl peptidase